MSPPSAKHRAREQRREPKAESREPMPVYKTPLEDIHFVLDEVLDVGQLATFPGYEEATPDVLLGVLEEGGRMCEDVLAPLNQSGDAEGCHYENGVVRTP